MEPLRKLARSILQRRLRDLLLFLDAFVGYVGTVAGTLLVEFLLHHQKFMTKEGFQEHLFTALGTGVIGSGLYLRQKPKASSDTRPGSSEPNSSDR